MDIDTMKVGLDFVEQIEKAVQSCDVLIAVIGKTWVNIQDKEGHRRLDNPEDFVRVEIQAALERNIPLIPLLVGGAGMPKASELPEPIAKLARRHAMKMSDERFRADATRLIEQIREYVTGAVSKDKLTSVPKPKPGSGKKRKRTFVPMDKRASAPMGRPSSGPKNTPTSVSKVAPIMPDGMVLIPKGPFLYGEERGRENISYDYSMDMYPVTNEQYKMFMLANGYVSQEFWSKEGWAWKQENQVTGQKYWSDPKWNKVDHPVVGVSFYEAEAYSSWTGKRLPTEQEWEKAARWKDGREYPWGNGFDTTKCNSKESGIDATTPVTKYTEGISPFGCSDMAGNVWEWYASWYDQSCTQRVIRGGSWYNFPVLLRSSNRGRYTTVNRINNLGFRLAQDIP